MMKKKAEIFIMLPLLLLLSCCSEEDSSRQETGEVVTLCFDLPGIRNSLNESPESRASGRTTSTSLMTNGTLFSVRAYKSNTSTQASSVFVDNGVYKVESSGTKATPLSDDQALKLTRGTYDLYFLSYNSSSTNDVPGAKDATVSISNGKDFIGVSLKKMLIQADKDGQTELTIPIDGYPFDHLCSRIKATLEIPKEQPVAPQKISDLKITLQNLRANNTYSWIEEGFTALGDRNSANSLNLITSGSLDNIQSSTTFPVSLASSDAFVLPLDESTELQFSVKMTVGYTDKKGNATTKTLDQTVELKKALLPGMSYNFVFSLTFYGDFLPADLTVDVKDYIPVELSPDDVGGDN